MRKELLKGLTDEQIEKASRCHSEAELLALAKEEGIELSDDELENIAGGLEWTTPDPCPCDSDDWDSVVD